MTPEGKIEAYLVKRVKETEGETRKLSWIGRRGAPDRFIWWRGPIMAFVELKALNKKPTAQQQLEHDRLRQAGFKVYVVDNVAQVDDVILELTRGL